MVETDSIFNEMSFLNPIIALGEDDSRNRLKFKRVCAKFDTVESILLEEWRTIAYHMSETEKKELIKDDIEKFWWKIGKMKNFNDELVFPQLSKLSLHILSLPHANADAERIFSVVSDVRTKKRNKLSHELLNSICIIRSSLDCSKQSCISFKCDENHFKKMNSKTVYDHLKN